MKRKLYYLLCLICAQSYLFRAHATIAVKDKLDNILYKLSEVGDVSFSDWTVEEKYRYALYSADFKHYKKTSNDYRKVIPESDLALIKNWPEKDLIKLASYYEANLLLNSVNLKEEQVHKVLKELSPEDKYVYKLLLPTHQKQIVMTRIKVEKEKQFSGKTKNTVDVALRNRNGEIKGEFKKDIEELLSLKEKEDLQLVYDTYFDKGKKRNLREKALTTYSKEYPSSPFLAEVYCMLGHMWSIHRRKGESADNKKADEYYLKARKHFKGKFSYDHITIWGSMVNRPYADIKMRVEYVNWIYFIKDNCSASDIFPVRSISSALKTGKIFLTDDRKTTIINHFCQHTSSSFLKTARLNTLWRTGDKKQELEILANTFPHKQIGIDANNKLNALTTSEENSKADKKQ